MKLTIKDIASKAGVSITTVSHILNDKGGRFSEETRAKVLKVVEENNYKPDYVARSMVTKRSKSIGMIVPDVTDFFFSKLIEGVETYLNTLGYMLILCNSKHDNEQEEKFFYELVHRAVEGIIIATPNILSKEIMETCTKKDEGIPIVLVDMAKNERDEGKLIVEERKGVYEATSYLIESNHRKIGFMKEVGEYYQLSERLKGYMDCLEKNNISFNSNYIVESYLTIEGGYRGTKQLLEQTGNDITALICSNDQMAMGAYQAIYESGLKIPDDISIIGFDGLDTSRYLAPSLTTVQQPVFDIGFFAAKFVVDAIENPYIKMPTKIFPTKLIIRESVKAID